MYKDGGILMQIFFIKKKSTSDHDADDHNGKPPPHTHCVGGRYPSVGSRKWGGNGRGLEEGYVPDPPNIPPYPPTQCVWGGGGTGSIPRSKVNRIF